MGMQLSRQKKHVLLDLRRPKLRLTTPRPSSAYRPAVGELKFKLL